MRALLFSGLCLALLACATPASRPSEIGMGPAALLVRQTVVADGHPLALWGKQPAQARGAVLLVHGRTWSARPNFDLQVPGKDVSVMNGFVRAGYAAYALDLRGYGETPRDATGWLTPERAADDVAATLDWIRKKHGPRAPVLVGYSRGASVALLAAQRHPQAQSALVLYGFPAVPVTPQPTPEVPLRQPNTATAAASDFITPGAASPDVIDAYVAQALASDPVRVDWKQEEQLVREPARVRVPTLIIYGARDPRLAPQAVAALSDALGTQDRAWVTLADSDHAAHVERAQAAWLHAIIGFIEQPR